MNNLQINELAKLYLDLGKLVFASLVLGFFQSSLDKGTVLAYEFVGLCISLGLFIMGIRLIKEIK